jgi:hypothetical protein
VAVDRGEAPLGANEIALGSAELAALGVSTGDLVTVQLPRDDGSPGTNVTAKVTGRAILASPAYQPLALGQGGVVPLTMYTRLGGDPAGVPSLMVRLVAGVAQGATYDDINTTLHPNFSFQRPDNFGVKSLSDIKTVDKALVTLLAVLSATSFLHLMFVVTRRSRRMMATMRSLGMTAAEARRAHMLHGALTAGAGLLVAIPVAILAATLTWRRLAEFLGAVADPVTSVMSMVVIAVVALAVGALGARTVGARQQRTALGQLLHSE